MATTVSAAKAKAKFAECIRKAEAGDPVVITRHGKAVVALVRADRLQQLERLRSAGPAAGLTGLSLRFVERADALQMSPRDVAPYAPNVFTEEMLKNLDEDLGQIPD